MLEERKKILQAALDETVRFIDCISSYDAIRRGSYESWPKHRTDNRAEI